MIRPRFSLRILLITVAVIGVPAGWIISDLIWIKERHAFLNHQPMPVYSALYRPAPWPLGLFGEHGIFEITIPESAGEQAHRLFPEAELMAHDRQQSPSGMKILFPHR
ncbi:MAG: hypothetical protein WAN65_18935 [Candidatus Sulfotelmatobacter sp.]